MSNPLSKSLVHLNSNPVDSGYSNLPRDSENVFTITGVDCALKIEGGKTGQRVQSAGR